MLKPVEARTVSILELLNTPDPIEIPDHGGIVVLVMLDGKLKLGIVMPERRVEEWVLQ